MTIKKQTLIFLCFTIFYGISISAQSPLDLTANVDLTSCMNCTYFAPGGFFDTEAKVINAFNFARRAEETNLSLTANALGTLTLPNNYSTLSATSRALFILNAERAARAGVSYSGTPSLGLPLESLETHLSTIAQNHTQDMITNNFFLHTSPTTGLDPYARIENSATFGPLGACRESMTYAENLYVACTGNVTTPTYTVEQAMFSWIYRDAISLWGHRRACFIQNINAYGATGFTNNVGSAASEGYLGIGIGTRVYAGTAYPACLGTFNAHIVTMNIVDPKPSCVANYTLPIDLLSFTGIYRNQYVTLKWATASEKDNAYFSVERSANGRDFYKFSEVKGMGNTNQQTNYTLDDLTPLKGVAYYRLVQADVDGKQTYSQVVAVNIDKKTTLSVYPNPTKGIIHVSTNTGADEPIEILNIMGAVVLKTTVNNATTVDLSEFAAGIYFVRMANGVPQRIAKY